MIGTFRANNPVSAFLLFIYGLLLRLLFFSHLPVPAAGKTDGFLYKELLLVLQTVSGGQPFIYSLLTYLLLFTQAVSFNKILNDQRLIQRSTYLPAMSYLLITALFPEWNILNSALIINTLLVWIWFKLNRLHNSPNPRTSLFNIGMATGISVFFYFPSIGFLVLIMAALLLSRPFNLAEWVITLAGVFAPFYYLFVWLFLSDNLKFYKAPVFVINFPILHDYRMTAAVLIIFIAFVTGAYFAQSNFRKQVVQIRNSWSLLFIYLTIALFVPFVNDTHSFKYWLLAALPLSAFIACAFLYPAKKWFPLLLHWLMAGLVVAISYYNK